MAIVGISRIVTGFLSAPLIGIFTANLFSFVLWAWRAPGIEVLSSAGLLQMYVYVLAVSIAALVVARRLALWGLLTWLAVGAICCLPACINNILFWSAASGGALVDAEFVFRNLALYLFAGAVAGGTFWLLAVVGNRALTRRSKRPPSGSASRPAGGAD
jgi:hypothetical protein